VRFDSTSDLRIKQQPTITREKSRKLKISLDKEIIIKFFTKKYYLQ